MDKIITSGQIGSFASGATNCMMTKNETKQISQLFEKVQGSYL